MNRKHVIAGFTLLEILMTLFILAILGAMVTSGLHTLIKTQDVIERKIKTLGELQLGMLTIERDLQQFKNQPYINASGTSQSAMSISPTGVEFTRGGFINPYTASPQDRTVQRIIYQYKQGALYRITREVENNTLGKPSTRILLKNIKNFRVQAVPKNNPLIDPSVQNQQYMEKGILPVGVIIELESKELGYIKRVIPLAINSFEQDGNAF